MIKSKNYYECHQFDHRIENCSEILKLISESFIHFNKRKRMCFNKKEQKNVKMRLIYKLFKAKITRVCLQQQTKMQNAIIKVNVINIVEKLFKFENEMNDEKKIHDKNILMKVQIIRQKIDFFRQKIF